MENCNKKIQELKMRLKKEKESKKKLKRKLKMKIAEKHLKMKAKLKHQKNLYRQLKSSVENSMESVLETNDFDNELPVTTQSSGLANGVNSGFQIDADFVRFLHPYAKTCAANPSKMYRCPNCPYSSDKKFNVKKHESSSHGMKTVRDMKCPICEKFFDYDGLRHHLNHFISGKFKTKNQHHSKFTPQQHQIILQETKLKKMN